MPALGYCSVVLAKMQTRRMSAVESATNVVVGYLVALASTFVIFPLVGVVSDPRRNLLVSAYFTAISLMRSYFLRRVFTKL